jgi:translation initiation factor IF-3
VNDRIRAPQVRLVGPDGAQIGIVSTEDAMRRAHDLDLDLVEVAPQADPPVCRIMDFGKYKYERDVRQKEARKKQQRVEVKEIKMRPKIDRHDYGTKKGHVERFLKQGARVKLTIMFRGREMAHTELGNKLLERLSEDLKELATVESFPKLDGRNMVMVFAPVKRSPVKAKEEQSAESSTQPEAGAEAEEEGQGELELAPVEPAPAEPAPVELSSAPADVPSEATAESN